MLAQQQAAAAKKIKDRLNILYSMNAILLWVLFFIFNLLGTVIQQRLDDLLMKSMQRESFLLGIIVALIVFTSLSLEVLLSAIFIFIKSKFYEIPNWPSKLITAFTDLIRETLKAIGNASLWCFAGILPGVSRFISYNFVPFVVFLNPNYQEGNIEVLSHIRKLVKSIKGPLILVWILFSIIFPIISNTLFSDYQNFSDTPVKAALVVLLESTIHLSWFLILYRMYNRLNN